MYNFSITKEQQKQVNTWLDEVAYPAAIKNQKDQLSPDSPYRRLYEESWKLGYPYGGAIGGGVTYSFTPTSLGLVIKVSCSGVKEQLDITDYDEW